MNISVFSPDNNKVLSIPFSKSSTKLNGSLKTQAMKWFIDTHRRPLGSYFQTSQELTLKILQVLITLIVIIVPHDILEKQVEI